MILFSFFLVQARMLFLRQFHFSMRFLLASLLVCLAPVSIGFCNVLAEEERKKKKKSNHSQNKNREILNFHCCLIKKTKKYIN